MYQEWKKQRKNCFGFSIIMRWHLDVLLWYAWLSLSIAWYVLLQENVRGIALFRLMFQNKGRHLLSYLSEKPSFLRSEFGIKNMHEWSCHCKSVSANSVFDVSLRKDADACYHIHLKTPRFCLIRVRNENTSMNGLDIVGMCLSCEPCNSCNYYLTVYCSLKFWQP